ncbi:MAG: hypothetical protein JSS86_09630 [Cyanobacteria bacterium SZAS LIN-2]|nr:hypothetical protein [Cyanobacteria bacterium SZAS LIN-3]MBS1996560.1 hypothetical protein [Cyanobacteria bacterium SZAS LIN-2]
MKSNHAFARISRPFLTALALMAMLLLSGCATDAAIGGAVGDQEEFRNDSGYERPYPGRQRAPMRSYCQVVPVFDRDGYEVGHREVCY